MATGCVSLYDPESSQEYRANLIRSANSEQTIGQSFVSRRPGLSKIQLWLQVETRDLPSDAVLKADLFYTAADQQPILSKSFSLPEIANTSTITIPVHIPGDPKADQEYYLRLSVNKGQVNIFGRSEDAYPKGNAFINSTPIDADFSFRLFYDYDESAFLVDLTTWLSKLWLVIPCTVLLWLPGRLVLRLTSYERQFDWGEKTAISIGGSISLLAIIMLWTSTLGIHWNRLGVLLLALAMVLAGLWIFRRELASFRTIRAELPALALACIFIFSLGVRLAMVRDLAAPAWIDSVHHATITRLILDQGALPKNYEPFIEVNTASYHAGYHSVLAFFTWLTGLDLSASMLFLGQVLNALAVIPVYLLTKTFTGSKTAGLFAALATGVITPMPAYYTSWGRYTQLTGLLILPPAFLFTKYLIDRNLADQNEIVANDHPEMITTRWKQIIRSDRFKTILLASILVAGIFLVHYRVMAFFIGLIAAYVFVRSLPLILSPRKLNRLIPIVGDLAILMSAAVLISFPWWPATLKTLLLPAFSVTGTLPPFSDFSWGFLTTAWGKYALGLAGLGVIWGFIQRRWFPLVMLVWIGLLFLLANLAALSLPGITLVNNTSVTITMFMPVSVLAGYLIGWVIEGWNVYIPSKLKRYYYASVSLLAAVVMIFAARALLPILNPITLLFRQADTPAMHWIDENIPENESIFINPFLWGVNIYAGSDGGHWISPLAGRQSLPPPVLYGLDFSGQTAGDMAARIRTILDTVDDPHMFHDALIAQGVYYVYIGARGGVISPKALMESTEFTTIYQNQGVYIFKAAN